jgi:hypothetical protein
MTAKASTRTFLAAMVLAVSTVLVGCVPGEPQFRRGPNPTVESIEAERGPFAIAQIVVDDADTPGFGGATIYYPTSQAEGTFGAVAISPGWVSGQFLVSWYGPRLASQGFVVITFDTNSLYDQPDQRATQLLAALDYVRNGSAVQDRVDDNRPDHGQRDHREVLDRVAEALRGQRHPLRAVPLPAAVRSHHLGVPRHLPARHRITGGLSPDEKKFDGRVDPGRCRSTDG